MSSAESKGPDVKSPPRMRWVWIVLALAVLCAVMLYLAGAEDTADVAEAKAPPPLQPVSIERVPVESQTVEISTFAEVRPRWSAELRAAVTGRVVEVLKTALAGERVAAGTTLISIENSRYVAELAAAELALKEAELALWQAKNASLVARKEYERSKRKPPNDLALKLPQLGIAESFVASAKARLAAARRQLADTTITAPFAGFVTERFVSPGQIVNGGERLVKLADNTNFELTAELGRADWLLLQRPLSGLTAKVLDQSGAVVAQARIRQGGGFLDETTRQYKTFLEINEPDPNAVLSGDFVSVVLPGVTMPAAMSIPASALTQEGYVWYLNAEDRLERMSPQVLFRRGDRIVIKAPQGADSWRIATTPLASFLPGQKVRPNRVEG